MPEIRSPRSEAHEHTALGAVQAQPEVHSTAEATPTGSMHRGMVWRGAAAVALTAATLGAGYGLYKDMEQVNATEAAFLDAYAREAKDCLNGFTEQDVAVKGHPLIGQDTTVIVNEAAGNGTRYTWDVTSSSDTAGTYDFTPADNITAAFAKHEGCDVLQSPELPSKQ